MRHTKNQSTPSFTDEEVLTTYLFSVAYERRFRVKDIYNYIYHHWLDYFPDLPSYAAYNARLNRMASIFPVLTEFLTNKYSEQSNEQSIISLTDSMPIIRCSGSRSGKVARVICDKGYNSTKKMYFHGVKLHGIGFYRNHKLPVIEFSKLSSASEHDLQAQRELLKQIPNRVVFGDKAVIDKDLKELFTLSGGELITPIKHKKGQ